MAATEVYDAVIVGSGAGGSAAAWALTRGGLRVLVLEAGPRFDPADYALHRPDWELRRFPEPPGSVGDYSFGPLQGLDPRWDHLRSWNHRLGRLVDGTRRVEGSYSHVRGTGGSTLHFSGEAHRLNPEAMRLATRFGVGADWPLSYADLEPFYAEAESVLGVAGPEGDRRRPRSTPYPLPPHPHSYASRRVAAGCAKLGLAWQPNALAILSRPYDGRPPCNYCGNCARGCPRTDKGSADVTFLRKALASGRCTLRTGCAVTQLVAGGNDRVDHLVYADGSGQQRAQGRVFVLACGAVETPRLLLCSTGPSIPQGLANESGQVGRNFLETLTWQSAALHPEPLGSHRGVPSDGICWDFNAPDAIPGVVGGCRLALAMAESGLIGPLAYARRVVGGWGADHKRAMRETFGRVLALGAIGECLPNPESFIALDPERRDPQGLPLARIHSHLGDDALERLAFMRAQCRAILAASGAGPVFEETGTYDNFNSSHVFGTCRMGSDPRDSVVDAGCRSHRWGNLYLMDASVFPSSGGGESPSLTIQALAIRAAGQVRARLLAGEV